MSVCSLMELSYPGREQNGKIFFGGEGTMNRDRAQTMCVRYVFGGEGGAGFCLRWG